MIKYFNFKYLGKPQGMYTSGKTGSLVIRTNMFRKGYTVRIVHGFRLKEFLESTRYYATIEALEADFEIGDQLNRRDFVVGQKSEITA